LEVVNGDHAHNFGRFRHIFRM